LGHGIEHLAKRGWVVLLHIGCQELPHTRQVVRRDRGRIFFLGGRLAQKRLEQARSRAVLHPAVCAQQIFVPGFCAGLVAEAHRPGGLGPVRQLVRVSEL